MTPEKLREDIKEAIQTCPPGKDCSYSNMQPNENVCIDCITDSILPLIDAAREEGFLEGVKKTTDAADSTYDAMLKAESGKVKQIFTMIESCAWGIGSSVTFKDNEVFVITIDQLNQFKRTLSGGKK